MPVKPSSPARPVRRAAPFLGLLPALAMLLCLSGCYSEFLGPAPGTVNLVASQPGGSYRLPSIKRTEYTVHLFWGIWTPKKTNTWKTVEAEVRGRQAAGIYNLEVETYMPWWHVIPAWLTGGIVDISGHTITADTFAYASNAPATPAAHAPPASPTPPPATPPPAQGDPTPTQKPTTGPLIQGDPHKPDTPAPRPGRDPDHATSPPPVSEHP